jgi:hypothetical protein
MRLMTFLALVLFSAAPQPPAREATAISAARNAVAQDIEKALPRVTFEAWVQGLVGAQAALRWETNDCGEQTGNPALDKGRDFPVCVEVEAGVAGGRRISLSLMVGSTSRGLTVGPPMFHHGSISGPEGAEMISIEKLADAPRLLGSSAPSRLRGA